RECVTLVETIAQYRPVRCMTEPATLDGGDVLRIGRRLWVGMTARTNRHGIDQLGQFLLPHGYNVQAVEVANCLHLKSACSYLGANTVLINPSSLDPALFPEFELIMVAPEEAAAANTLTVNGWVIIPDCFPKTIGQLQSAGFAVRPVDISQLQKAEAGVT